MLIDSVDVQKATMLRFNNLLLNGGYNCTKLHENNNRYYYRLMYDHYEEVKSCISVGAAKYIYDKYLDRIQTATKREYNLKGINILECIDGGNNSSLYQILIDGKIWIFKCNKEPEFLFSSSIVDHLIYEQLKDIPGIVPYLPYEIDSADRKGKVLGCLSEYYYEGTLVKLINIKMENTILSFIDQMLFTLSQVHNKGFVICDLKPENIFITNKFTTFLIGDLGGVKKIGEVVTEYTADYLPEEYVMCSNKIAAPSMDLWCLVTSVLRLLNIELIKMDKESIASAVNTTEDTMMPNVKDKLLHVLAVCLKADTYESASKKIIN